MLIAFLLLDFFLGVHSFPDTHVTSAAVRHGCIVLSIDICGLLSNMDAHADADKEYTLARDVALKWLQRSVPKDKLAQGPTFDIMVRGAPSK